MAQLHCRRASRRVYRRRRRAAETGIGVQERLWRPAVMAAFGLILGFGRKPRKICVRGSLEEQKEHQNPHTLKRSCEETLRISVLQKSSCAVSSRHEPRKSLDQTTVDPLCQPAADELARGRCGTPD